MKSLFFVSIYFFASLASGAVSKTTDDLRDIMSLPEKNRIQVFSKKSAAEKQAFYSQLIGIAKDQKQTMGFRWKAVTSMAVVGGSKSTKDLDLFLKDKDWYMRSAALLAYQVADEKKGHKKALEMLRDKALVVRSTALQAIQSNLTSEERDTLWTELNETRNFRKKQSLWVRAQILDKLAADPKKSESSLFFDALKDSDSRLHAPAMMALEKIVSPPWLAEKVKTPEERRKKWLSWAQTNSSEIF